jgi:hypothetical protein
MRREYNGAARAWLAAIAMCWAGAALAADPVIGSVLAVRGDVFLDSGAGRQPVAVNLRLHRSDTIFSDAGKAKIALNDGTVVSIGENSRLVLADYERVPGNVKARFNLVSGALRVLAAKVSPGGKFEIETETAIAAVRGTDWVIEATPERTSVALVRGKVAVSARGVQAPAVVLSSPGQGTDVRPGSAPTPAVPWGARRLADTLARATFE